MLTDPILKSKVDALWDKFWSEGKSMCGVSDPLRSPYNRGTALRVYVMTEIFNKKEMKERRQSLRNQATETEVRLWEHIRKKQILGVRFRRQFSIGHYIVDFYSPKIKLAIEIDGKSHDSEPKREYDATREKEIRQLGINVLRFRNHEVLDEIDNVVRKIEDAIKNFPLKKGEAKGVDKTNTENTCLQQAGKRGRQI